MRTLKVSAVLPPFGLYWLGAGVGLTYNKLTALAIIRALRSGGALLPERTELVAPRLAAGSRWTWRLVSEGVPWELAERTNLYVAVPDEAKRIRARRIVNTIYSTGLAPNAFLRFGDDNVIAGPELLFVELGALMPLAVQVMVGYELCGTFSRSATNPRMGPVRYHIAPATSVQNIEAFLRECHGLRGTGRAWEALRYVSNNAWSPTEATIATMSALPASDFGYDLGAVRLNVRTESTQQLRRLGGKGSRVPDIMFADTCVGLNYDGKEHFDLDGLVALLQEGGGVASANQSASSSSSPALTAKKRKLRRKLVDDVRRTRELAASGLVVLPVTSEDLFERGAFDALMLEAMCALEHFADLDFSQQKLSLQSSVMQANRQLLVWSLLPWEDASKYARELALKEYRAFSKSKSVVTSLDVDLLNALWSPESGDDDR